MTYVLTACLVPSCPKRHGVVAAPRSAAESLADRLWEKVDKSGGPDACWLWTARRGPDGYGQIKVDGQGRQAHRVVMELTLGEAVPKHLYVCHRCDNPPCCNPAHLFVGTPSDNQRDSVAKGRHGGGMPQSATCRNGHPMSGDNVKQTADGRRCRTCAIEDGRRRRARLAASPTEIAHVGARSLPAPRPALPPADGLWGGQAHVGTPARGRRAG